MVEKNAYGGSFWGKGGDLKNFGVHFRDFGVHFRDPEGLRGEWSVVRSYWSIVGRAPPPHLLGLFVPFEGPPPLRQLLKVFSGFWGLLQHMGWGQPQHLHDAVHLVGLGIWGGG